MNKQEIKEKSFSVRCTEKEMNILTSQARKLNITLSDYALRACLNQKAANTYTESKQLLESLCKMQLLINKFKSMLLSRKDFIKEMEKEINKLWQN